GGRSRENRKQSMRRLLQLLIAVAALSVSAGNGADAEPIFLDQPLSQWLKALNGSDVKARRSAAFALGKIGADAAEAMPALAGALEDADATVRDAAAFAL